MRVIVQVVTGYTYTGDSFTMDEIRAEAQAENPGMTEVEFEQQLAKVVEMMGKVGNLDNLNIKINGNDRSFNAKHVVWVEVDLEGESLPTAATEAAEAEREAQRAERDRIRNEQLARFDGRAVIRPGRV